MTYIIHGLQLRQTLVSGKNEAHDFMHDFDCENNDADGDSDSMDDADLSQNSINVDAEVSMHNEKVCRVRIISFQFLSRRQKIYSCLFFACR